MTESADVQPGMGAETAGIARRHDQILGGAPRIEPLQIDEYSGDLDPLIRQMIAINQSINAREAELLTDVADARGAGQEAADMAVLLARLPEIIRTMLRHPTLFARQTDVGVLLLTEGRLAPRDRELAILRIAWLCQAPYEWGEHILIARHAGIGREDVERIIVGSTDAAWNANDRAILRAVEELHGDAMIQDDTWATLATRLDPAQLIELPILIGQYQTVAYYQNALKLRLHGGNAGLAAR
ncbi:carboxymuconolactone decarboxylase family protein [Sphingobium sp. AP49]|uniref:carboxymuconolactone decarboxylase family protein n=1 Tax=Sphingobium sp. AP49 TaxID=1144307 RepID=UPI00026ECF1C|nr:carboxymuconolactone decarboxylase family protein [Sphingobium sp. AP49]WHO37934.1 carboxymuconolactone decarboxylase family protein [Sphingobium sp. AP49]